MSARPFSLRLGMREYLISNDEFMNPGSLVDSLLDEKICETGGFIGRLETWSQVDGDKNVTQVKAFINEPSTAHHFHPESLHRRSLMHRTLFDVNPVHDQTVESTSFEKRSLALGKLTRLQSRMRDDVNKCNFSPLPEEGCNVELSNLLLKESTYHCADLVSDNLENEINDVVYLQNMAVSPPLETCSGVAMSRMNTGLEKLGNKEILGVNQPSVYIGTELSTFPCHREDMAFLVMNRHIAGAPKVWFCVPPAYYESFIWMLRNLPIPEEQKSNVCQLLHKNLWISPSTVVACGIPVYAIVQCPGDVVFLLPNTIHWGFNVGFNMNEAINFACRAWVLPAMICHQRCHCKKGWHCRFEIRDVLVEHEADREFIQLWSTGFTHAAVVQLRRSQPLLYPRLKDAFQVTLDEELMAEGVVKASESTSEMDGGVPFAKCTLCSYSPKRCRSDAYDRIKAHVIRCHGPELADQVIDEARNIYESNQELQKKMRTYKCPPIKCDRCLKVFHGNASSIRDHQAGRRCVPVNQCGSVPKPEGGRRRSKRNVHVDEDVDDPDSPSSLSGTKSKRRK